jgi:hypothetical protein
MFGAIFSAGAFCCAAGGALSAGLFICADATPALSSKPAATVDKRYARFIFVSSGNPTKLDINLNVAAAFQFRDWSN